MPVEVREGDPIARAVAQVDALVIDALRAGESPASIAARCGRPAAWVHRVAERAGFRVARVERVELVPREES